MPKGHRFRIKNCGSHTPPRAGCTCFRCTYRRSYNRQWAKKVRREGGHAHETILKNGRIDYQRHREVRIADRRTRYFEHQLANLMYFQLLRIVQGEGQDAT